MENGRLKTSRYAKLGIPRIKHTPNIVVKGVEIRDPIGPYGAKGVGEIGLIPTAGAVANALYQYDKIRRYELPMKRRKQDDPVSKRRNVHRLENAGVSIHSPGGFPG